MNDIKGLLLMMIFISSAPVLCLNYTSDTDIFSSTLHSFDKKTKLNTDAKKLNDYRLNLSHRSKWSLDNAQVYGQVRVQGDQHTEKDLNAPSSVKLMIDELYIDVDVTSSLYVGWGRKNILNGSSYIESPIDFFNRSATNTILPIENKNKYQVGHILMSIEYYQSNQSLHYYHIPRLPGIDSNSKTSDLFKYTYSSYENHLDLDILFLYSDISSIGYSIVYAMNPNAHMYLEYAYLNDFENKSYKRYLSEHRDNVNNQHIVLGTIFSLSAGLDINVNFRYQEKGVKKSEWREIESFVDHQDMQQLSYILPHHLLAQYYTMSHISYQNSAWKHELDALFNMQDWSHVWSYTLRYEYDAHLSLHSKFQRYSGHQNSEFGLRKNHYQVSVMLMYSF